MVEAAVRHLAEEGIPSGHVVAVGFVFDTGMRSKNEASRHAYSTTEPCTICHPAKETAMFDEKRLREDIAGHWGEHGAHVIVLDHIIALAESRDAWVAERSEAISLDLAAAVQERDRLMAAIREWVSAHNDYYETPGNLGGSRLATATERLREIADPT